MSKKEYIFTGRKHGQLETVKGEQKMVVYKNGATIVLTDEQAKGPLFKGRVQPHVVARASRKKTVKESETES